LSLIWIRNWLRGRLRYSMIGRAVLQVRPLPPVRSIRVVCATRQAEKHFWRGTALGRSLKPWLSHPSVSAEISYANQDGLPRVYNRSLDLDAGSDVLVFVHDDVWLDDSEWIAKLRLAFERFDIIGVAGNRRRSPRQPAWLFRTQEGERFIWDNEYLSGSVSHGTGARGPVSHYGPAPVACELLDGVFMAVRSSLAQRSRLRFDERFDFHFYDMDFCRQARAAGLSLGTWPIALTHQSAGAFGSPGWTAGLERYRAKWPR
jgi:GT2 family glycosyltransferase